MNTQILISKTVDTTNEETTLIDLCNVFHTEWDKRIEHNKGTIKELRLPPVKWEQYAIKPILDAVAKELGLTYDREDIRHYRLRAHVPTTFMKDGKEYLYIDMDNSLSDGTLRITDYSEPITSRVYKPNTIGAINGFDNNFIRFEGTATIKEVVQYIKNNLSKFISEPTN